MLSNTTFYNKNMCGCPQFDRNFELRKHKIQNHRKENREYKNIDF